MVEGDREDCPACGAAVDGEPWCGSCGLGLRGDEAIELRNLSARLAGAEADLQASWARRDALAKQLADRRWAHGMSAAVAAPAPPKTSTQASTSPTAEWNVERVRNVLLWTGATLLALSALAFTAVAWTHLNPTGRAALLVSITVVSAAAATLLRSRLPATAGALTGLAIALAIIDWQVARRAGAAPGLSGTAWWAIGTAVVSGVAFALGQIASRRPAQRAFALLAPSSAVLILATDAHAAWSGALGLSALATALVFVSRRSAGRTAHRAAPDPVVGALVRIEAVAIWVVGAAFSLFAAFGPHTLVQAATPAAVMLSLILAPAMALTRSSAPSHRTRAASVAFAAVIGAGVVLLSTSVGPVGLMTAAAALGGACFASGRGLDAAWRRAANRVGPLAAAPGLVFAGSLALYAELGPPSWLGHAWTGRTSTSALTVIAGPTTQAVHFLGWCVVAILAAAAVATAFAFRPTPAASRRVEPTAWAFVPLSLLLLAAALVAAAARFSVLLACAAATAEVAVAVGFAALAARRTPECALPYGLLAVLPALPAAGWAAVTPAASITALAVVAVVALAATIVDGRAPELRAAHAALGASATVALAAVGTLAAGASVPEAGFVAAVVSGAILVGGSQLRRDTADGFAFEVLGVVGVLVGAALATQSWPWLAGTLTAAVPLLLAASLRGNRLPLYGSGAALAALAATWSWLAAAGVTVVEAYTLPAAAVAFGLTAFAVRVRSPNTDDYARSWLNLGPALVLALGPTLVLAIARHDDARAIVVGLAALAVVLAGSRQRLQAPIALGALTLVILGIDKIGPAAVRLPRWLMLAFAGSVLLLVGTTFERRRDAALRAARRFERFG